MADAAAPTAGARAASLDLGQAAVGIGAAAGIGALGAADGGYFPPSWGWTALLALWLLVGLLLLGRSALHGGPLAGAFAAAVVAVAAWTWLSLAWTENDVQTALEGFRALAYAAAVALLALVLRPRAAPALVHGLLAAITLVSLYGLATRLFPDRLGTYEPISTYRLSEPLGYWNGVGIFAAMGALLALGTLARDRSTLVRALAAAAFVLLLPTIYFTFSRGAAVALAVGVVSAVALDPRRLQLLLALFIVAVPGAIAVWIGSESEALTHRDSPLSAAVAQGQEVALLTLILAGVAAAGTAALALAERRIHPPRAVRLAFAAVVAAAAVAAVGAVFVRFGGPVDLVERGYDAFRAPPQADPTNLGERLFRFSGNYRAQVWEQGWNQFVDHPVVGAGAGTYEQYWNANRPIALKVRDGHSLYVETLGELGAVGFALLVIALAVPLLGAVRARRHPLAAGVFGAYAAYLFHAGVDWDWELPAVTLAALACGAVLLVLGRDDRASPLGSGARIAGASAAVVLSVVAFVGLIGASALAASDEAAQASPPNWAEAEDEARKAETWAPWSSEPWQRLGEAQAAQGRVGAARASFRKAIEKEPRDWLLWYRLAETTTGAERRRALARAEALNPRSPEAEALRAEGAAR